jgi:type IX secretion system PorP/SprF family membrane protein
MTGSMLRSVLLLLLCAPVFAQQKPHYTQYFQNMSVLNPAVTGMYHRFTVRSGHRTQWQGLESAPKTNYLTLSSPINTGSSQSGFVDYGIEDPGTRDDKLDYMSSLSHHGVGLVLLKDQTGPLSRTIVNLTYAYHINISDVANLSVGVGGGINRLGLNTSSLRFEDENEPLTADGGTIGKLAPDLNAGFYLYGANFFLGGSVQQVLNQNVSLAYEYEGAKDVPHYFLTSGFKFWVKEDFNFTPSVMLKYIQPLPLSYDLNLKIGYRNNVWIGGSFRKKDAFAALFGFNVAKVVSLGYSFDHTNSQLKEVSSGTHEVVLGLNF